MIPLIYLAIVGLFVIFSLIIIYHLYRFGVNKVFINLVTIIYIIASLVVILQGLVIASKF